VSDLCREHVHWVSFGNAQIRMVPSYRTIPDHPYFIRNAICKPLNAYTRFDKIEFVWHDCPLK
jgi:hypothetical protein